MSKVKISTLSPVHIGNGNSLQANSEFVTSGNYIYVIDPHKVLDIIGDKELDEWVRLIENEGNIKDFISKFEGGANPENYAIRKIKRYCTLKDKKDFKECIHDGRGVPYIPGSSIKGAIRSAVLATEAAKRKGLEGKIRDYKGKITASVIEKEFFGDDPQKDIFRFLRVGDAYFKEGCECAMCLVNLNIRNSEKDLLDRSKSQIVEAISGGSESTLRIDFDSNRFSQGKGSKLGINSISSLFKIINAHTRCLVENEIKYWEKSEKTGAEGYVKALRKYLSMITKCESNECILRVGHAIGWRFITGAWAENLKNFYDKIVPIARPNPPNPKDKDGDDDLDKKNKKEVYKYADYVFPKSRRVDEGAEKGEEDLLGFIKLTIEE